ncbi:eCIS core domain-containing protein [Streptomyces anulatus]|uniref:eCIS core domain-containing protein n=1 Tax=Streptomyces anulatus TaxID=1892 RepID=UPI0035DDFDF9
MRDHENGTGSKEEKADGRRSRNIHRPDTAPPDRPRGLSGLQTTVGNAAVVQMLRRAGHAWAHEEHRHSAGCGHRPDEQTAPAVQLSAVHNILRTSGQPMDDATRTDMEARLGADFSDVRIHNDSAARASATEIGARAYTSGNHVVIGTGGTDKHTLAHELTHVIQQRQGPVAGTDNGTGLKVSEPSDRFEREAEANATRVMRRSVLSPARTEGGVGGGARTDVPVQRSVMPVVVQRAGCFDGLRTIFHRRSQRPGATSLEAIWREYGDAMLPNLERHVQEPLTAEQRQSFQGRWEEIRERAAQVAELDPELLVGALREIGDIRLQGSSTAAGAGVAPQEDAQPATIQWKEADRMVQNWAEQHEHPTMERIKELHRVLASGQENNNGEAGQLRDAPSPPMGKNAYFIPGTHVSQAMAEFVRWYNEEVSKSEGERMPPVELAAKVYQYLVSIHPYRDGNGRLSRLVMDWVCRLHGLPAPALGAEDTQIAAFGRTKPGEGVDRQNSASAIEVVEKVTSRLESALDMLLREAPGTERLRRESRESGGPSS